jgi:catechol 2,3-dioxygenase-like lactoylglutathione lyase family enzyme
VWRLLAVTAFGAALAAPSRPRIVGISHVCLKVSNVAAARSFYEKFLGLKDLRVNPRQYVELIPGLAPDEDRLDHVALETDDAEALRRYLASRGIDVPDRITRDETRRRFAVPDPDGHAIEFVEPPSASRRPSAGARVSDRMLHFGIIVGDVPASMKFYGDVLGFRETWRGSRSGTELSWINVKLMESRTVDGQPAPSSTAPPPRRP